MNLGFFIYTDQKWKDTQESLELFIKNQGKYNLVEFDKVLEVDRWNKNQKAYILMNIVLLENYFQTYETSLETSKKFKKIRETVDPLENN